MRKSQKQTTISDTQRLQKIYPELNLEKWVMWKPSHSTRSEKKAEERYEREVKLKDGTRVKAQVIIRSAGNLGLLTTEDQKTYYSLVKIWEENGRTIEDVPFSLRKLARLQHKKWGTKTLKSIIQSLERLGSTTLEWNYAFYDDSTGEVLQKLRLFHVLSHLEIAYRTEGAKIDRREAGTFRFNPYVLNNLLHHYTKPVYFDIILNFQSEISQLLYTYLDLVMADKTCYERKTEGLFRDLGLDGGTYAYPSKRKEKLLKPIEELQGVPLTSGILIEASIQPAKNSKDFKVVFKKQSGHHKKTTLQKKEPSQTDNHLQAAELITYFHDQLKHPGHSPTCKELNHATELLTRHESHLVHYIVDYAITRAAATNFDMQHFGAIMQYEEEALAAYARREERRKHWEKQQQMIQESIASTQIELPSDIDDPRAYLQAKFDALDPETQTQIREAAAAKLASHKSRMKPKIYEETLQTTIYQELQLLEQKK